MGLRVVVAGGSGYIGRALCHALGARGYEIVALSRSPDPVFPYPMAVWDGKNLGDWQKHVDGARAVINLAGERVSKHWNEANKLSILESRIYSTQAIGKAIAACGEPPEVWINASAIGYYGDRGGEELTESSPPGPKGDFLADVCVAWEDEQTRAATPSTRKVRMRTGVVFGHGSLASEPLRKAVRCFVGGPIGNGQQYMSWIHIVDLVGLYLWALESPSPLPSGEAGEVGPESHPVEGALNVCAPEPATSEYLMSMMRAILKRPWAPPVPAFALKLLTWLGGPDASLLLSSERAVPNVALAGGFQFQFGTLREALVELLVSL